MLSSNKMSSESWKRSQSTCSTNTTIENVKMPVESIWKVLWKYVVAFDLKTLKGERQRAFLMIGMILTFLFPSFDANVSGF